MSEHIHIFDKYLRENKMPHMWCAGCGNGIVLQAILRAIEQQGLDQDQTVIVAGIGCSSRANGYTDFCGVHTNHGRALAYATGIKMQNPDLNIIVIMGDGDCTSIGGNHFIHACRRNIDLTAVVFNNSNYGMTGGQYSPTTPESSLTKSTVYGNVDPSFDICKLAEGSGATYVARSTTYHATMMANQIAKAIGHKGFSVVEAMCDCPTLYGRLNKKGTALDMLLRWKQCCVTPAQAAKMSTEELMGKIIIGEFVNSDQRPEYTQCYAQVRALAQKEG